MILREGEGLLQLFQHAHHRVEGHLIDFCEGLEEGRREAEFLARASHDLSQHIFVEEQFLFPLLRERLAAVVGSLEEEHGRVLDLMEGLQGLLLRDTDREALQTCTARLTGALTAHNTAEDLGIYPDLLFLLGHSRAQELLLQVERAMVPRNWVCAARLRASRLRPVAS